MRASLAVALSEYNGCGISWKIRSTIFTKPNASVIVAAVVFKFHVSVLQKFICVVVAAPTVCVGAEDAAHQRKPDASPSAGSFDAHAAERFAKLALQCVHKEYPSKISHVLNSDADVAPPQKLTPAFYASAAYLYSLGHYGGISATSHWNQGQVSADYFLSKRTDVYVYANYVRASGDLAKAVLFLNAPSSSKQQTAVVAGIRHTF